MNKKLKVVLGVATIIIVAGGIIFGITSSNTPKKTIEVYVEDVKMETLATINDKNEVVVDADWFASVSENTFDATTQTVLQTNTEVQVSTDKNQIGIDKISSLGWKVEFKDGDPATLKLYTPIEVVVPETPVEPELLPITLESITGTISKDETIQIVATYEGANTFTYLSSNPEVAVVTESGLVQWVGEGTSTITVSTEDGYPATYETICNKLIVSEESSSSQAVVKEEGAASSITVSPPEIIVPDTETKPSTSNKNEVIELEDSHDQRKWEAGVGVSFDSSYSDGMSRKEVLADIQEIVKPYGLQVMGSGTIGSGASNSSGYIAIDDSDGTWKLYIYAWRSSPTDSGLNQTINSTLQVFKYFLGTENGSTLWSFIDASFTKQDPSVSDYNMTDTEYEGKTGEFTFSNGNNVGYDQSNSPRYIVFTLS